MTDHHNWEPAPRPDVAHVSQSTHAEQVAHDPWSTDFEQVRATVQALQGAATLLQGAMQQRQGLWSEMRNAEQKLTTVEAQRREAEQALTAASAGVNPPARARDQVRHEQQGVLPEFARLVQSALARRTALLAEISELERQREALATGAAPSPVTHPSTEESMTAPDATVTSELVTTSEP